MHGCWHIAILLLTVIINSSEASSIQTYLPQAMQTDKRLDTKLAFSARGQDIEEFLEAVGEQCQAVLKVSRPLRDRRVTVIVKGVPARRVLASLAKLFGTDRYPARWRVRDARKPVYLLWKDERALEERDELRQEANRRMLGKIREIMDLVEAGDKTLDRMRAKDPLLAEALRPGDWESTREPAFKILSSWGPEALQQAVLGSGVYKPFASLSPELQQLYFEKVGFRERHGVRDEGGDSRPETDTEVMERLQQSTIGFRFYEDSTRCGLGLVARDPDGKWESEIGMRFFPKEPFFPAPLESDTKAGEEGSIRKEAHTRPVSAQAKSLAFKRLIDLQAWLAETVPLNIVSDYYMQSSRLSASFPSIEITPEMTLAKALERIETAYHYAWDSMEDIYLFRNRFWLEDDATQIPERILKTWRRGMKRNRYLRLEELSQMARCSDAQLETIEDEFPIAKRIGDNRSLLLLYGMLDMRQKTDLLGNDGLPLIALNSQQAELLKSGDRGSSHWRNTIIGSWERAALRMSLERKSPPGRVWFIWMLEGRPWLEWPIDQ